MFELTTLEDYSDAALLGEIKRIATALNGRRLTQERFSKLSKVHVTTVRNRFGSWQKALDLAEIDEQIAPRFNPVSRETVLQAISLQAQEFPETSPTVEAIAHRLGLHRSSIPRKFGAWRDLLREVGFDPVPLGRRYTDEECFENIVALWTYYGRQPNFAELNQAPSSVGSKAYVLRWGGWRAALGAFIKHVNQPIVVNELQAPCQDLPGPTEPPPISAPRSISVSLRYKVLCRDHFKCVICGRSPAKDHSVVLHVDHIIAWSKGGQNIEENLRTLCLECNLGKGDKIERA
jgi:hypothetical protein